MKKFVYFVLAFSISMAVIADTPDGIWQSDNEILVISGGQWALYESGNVTDGGRYDQDGNRLVSQSQFTGHRRFFQFSRAGNVLELRENNGAFFQYRLQGSSPTAIDKCAGLSFEECLVRNGYMPPSVNIWE